MVRDSNTYYGFWRINDNGCAAGYFILVNKTVNISLDYMGQSFG
jgi:hypothetical protein